MLNFESSPIFESLVDCFNNEKLTLRQILTILERFMAAFDESSTGLLCTTSKDQGNYCRVCLDHTYSFSKCLHINNPETFVYIHNYNFNNWPSVCTNNRLHRRRPVHWLFRPSNRGQKSGEPTNSHDWIELQLHVSQTRIHHLLWTRREA